MQVDVKNYVIGWNEVTNKYGIKNIMMENKEFFNKLMKHPSYRNLF